MRPRRANGLQLFLFWLAGGALSDNAVFEKGFDLGETNLCLAVAQSNHIDQLAQLASHSGGEMRILGQHGRNCLDGAAFVEQQHEELFTHFLLEGRKRQPFSGLLPHAPKQIETALVNDALRHADIKKCADHCFARPPMGDGLLQLIDPPSNQLTVRSILARPLSRSALRRLETDKRLQQG